MKKIILSAVAVFAFGFANAQSSDMKFGVKAGYTSSTFTGDFEGDGTTGFYVGGLVDFAVSESFHVQPELLYSMEGAKDSKLNYLRIPIMAKYYVMQGLSLQAGPELGFVAGGDSEIKDGVKSMDYGLGIGAGYELASGLMFDARYNLGMANIVKEGEGKLGTASINIGLGYRF
jgi:hypothetical protein